jgi:hypothetical protein
MQITIKTPSDFNFQRTVLSHGWCELLPFELDRRTGFLRAFSMSVEPARLRSGSHPENAD